MPLDAGQEIVVGVAVTQIVVETVVEERMTGKICDGIVYGGGVSSSLAEDVPSGGTLPEEKSELENPSDKVAEGVVYGAASSTLDVPLCWLVVEYGDVATSCVDGVPEGESPSFPPPLDDPIKGVLKLYPSLVDEEITPTEDRVDEYTAREVAVLFGRK